MAAGYDLSGQDLKRQLQALTFRWRQLLRDTDDILVRLGDFSDADIEAAYAAAGSTDPTSDLADVKAALAAMEECLIYAVTASSTVVRIDNTASDAQTVTVSLQPGEYCVHSSNATDRAQMESLGTDKGPAIRKLSPITTQYGVN